jgi:hypothetical protein
LTPNAEAGDGLSSGDDEDDDADDAMMQVQQVEGLSLADEFVTPQKRKASEVSCSIELLDSE